MFKNYLLTSFRNLLKYRGYSAINIAGLSIGLACFILIFLYIADELSYDRYHPGSDRIYRMAVDITASEGLQRNAQTPPVWSETMPDLYPEIEMMTRFKPPRQTWMVSNEDKDIHFSEKWWVFAEDNVFDMFEIPLLSGNEDEALSGPQKVVISERMAGKYFDDENPIGKNLVLDNQWVFNVSGVFRNMPENSHFHYDFLASFQSLEDSTNFYLFNVPQGQFPFVYTYMKLREDAAVADLEAKFPQYVNDHIPEQFRPDGREIRIYTQPITDIHLKSNLENEIEPNNTISTIYIFASIALFVLLIACVNFMNLATAQSTRRVKEVGMRKAMGASQGQVATQFLSETIILTLVALIIAFAIVYITLPTFNHISDKEISSLELLNPAILLVMVLVAVSTGFVAGIYPSYYISSTNPATVLKTASASLSGGNTLIRRVLIVVQFSISVFLIIGTLIVYQQMRYTRDMEMGIQTDQVLVVQLTDPTPMNLYRSYKTSILTNPDVVSVTASFSAPASLVQQAQVRPVNTGSDELWQVHLYIADFDFLETMGIELLAGRDIREDAPADTVNGVLLNETAIRSFGWEDPEDALGRELNFPGNPNNNRVIGVVKDFHSMSARERISPTLIGYFRFGFFAFVRVRPGNIDQTIDWLRTNWEETVPGYVFDYSFLDSDFEQLYKDDKVLNQLLTYFSGLAIFIACLGLFGLSSFITRQRSREIGIRKVMGSSVFNIIVLLSRNFTRLVLIGFLFGGVGAFFVMDRWLQGFAYSTTIGLEVFLIAGVVALAAALVTVSYQTFKAATVNPVRSLRNE